MRFRMGKGMRLMKVKFCWCLGLEERLTRRSGVGEFVVGQMGDISR